METHDGLLSTFPQPSDLMTILEVDLSNFGQAEKRSWGRSLQIGL
ncbi:MAG: hypothetical protein WHV66_01305 [Anaerolineales bacterium]